MLFRPRKERMLYKVVLSGCGDDGRKHRKEKAELDEKESHLTVSGSDTQTWGYANSAQHTQVEGISEKVGMFFDGDELLWMEETQFTNFVSLWATCSGT